MSNNKFYVFDIETKGGFCGDFLIGAIYDGRKCQIFENEDIFMEKLLSLKGIVFAHYLEYDIRFILQYLKRKKIKLTTMPILAGGQKVIEWRIKDVILRDSFVLTQSSLKNLAKTFRLKEKKLNIDYENIKKTLKLRQYLKNDVIILFKVLKSFFNFVGIENIKKRTIASVTLAKFKKIDPISYSKITEYPIYQNQENFIRESYFMGYDFRRKKEIIAQKDEEIIKIDCNSFFGYAMMKNNYPWGPTFWVEKEGEIKENLKYNMGIIQVIGTIPKDLEFGFLPIRNKKGMVKYPNKGKIKGTYTSTDILFAEELGYKFKFKRAIFWEFQDFLFRKYINHLSKIKEKSKGAKRLIAKNLIVSLYGKFGHRRDISIFKYNDDLPEVGKFYLDDEQTISYEQVYRFAEYSHPEISAFTTSYSRIFLYKKILEIGFKNIHSIMIDSMVISVPFNQRKLIKNWIDKEKIGKFKIESEIKEGIFLKKGIYAIKDKKGREIIKHQGIDRTCNVNFEDIKELLKKGEKEFNAAVFKPPTIYSVLKRKRKITDKFKPKKEIKL